MELVAAAALEADRIVGTMPRIMAQQQQQRQRVLEAARALLAVSNPHDLDLPLLQQPTPQVASLHRAFCAILSWCCAILSWCCDVLSSSSSSSDQNKNYNTIPDSSFAANQSDLWTVICELEMRAFALELPLHLPLYKRLLAAGPFVVAEVVLHENTNTGSRRFLFFVVDGLVHWSRVGKVIASINQCHLQLLLLLFQLATLNVT